MDDERSTAVEESARQNGRSRRGGGLLSWLALGVVLAAGTAVFFVGADEILSGLMKYEGELHRAVSEHYALTASAFALSYFVVVSLCLPVSAVLAVLWGFLFGWPGLALTVVFLTAGAMVPYGLARTTVGAWLLRRAEPHVERFRPIIRENQTLAVVLLNILPWAPFAVMVIVCGTLMVRPRSFAVGTLLGSLPGSLALNLVGQSLDDLVALRDTSLLSDLMSEPRFYVLGATIVALLLVPRAVRRIATASRPDSRLGVLYASIARKRDLG